MIKVLIKWASGLVGSESVLGSHYSSILNLDQIPLNNWFK